MLTLKDTSGKTLVKSDSALISIGREDDNTFCVNEESVSGYHGLFFFIDGRWIYRDNFSTNGSFFNGSQMRSGQSKWIKNGDAVRLATFAIQCDLRSQSSTDQILVLKGFEPLGSHLLPKDSETLIVDSNSGINYKELSATLTFSRTEVGALAINTDSEVLINGKPHTGNLALLDQDQIDIGEYTILVCYSGISAKPQRHAAASPNAAYDPARKMEESGKRAIFSAENSQEPVKSSSFRAEISMSQRLGTIADDEATKHKNKIEQTYAAFGVLVLFTTISFVVFAISLL